MTTLSEAFKSPAYVISPDYPRAVVNSFRFHRGRGMSAIGALHHARVDYNANARRYPHRVGAMRGGAAFMIGTTAVFWCEDPDAHLRRVGFADECVRLRHTGWYCDDSHSELARGVVFQLPARNGAPRFMYGVADPNNDGPAMLAHDIAESKEDAARWADQLAEQYAEGERDYRAASNARAEYEELGAQIATDRRATLALIREAKSTCSSLAAMPETRRAIERAIRSYLAVTEHARTRRAVLARDFGRHEGFQDY